MGVLAGAEAAFSDLTSGRLRLTSFVVPAGAGRDAVLADASLKFAAAAYLARFKGTSRARALWFGVPSKSNQRSGRVGEQSRDDVNRIAAYLARRDAYQRLAAAHPSKVREASRP